MKKLIITADDFGMDKSVNEAIIAGIKADIIKSTNIMMGMPYFIEAKKMIKDYPNCSYGIHWTCTAGSPVLNPNVIPSLIDNNGQFHNQIEFIKRFKKGKINKGELLNELEAQYNLFVINFGEPDYWNTHQNVHINFGLFFTFTKLASRLNITKMRSHKKIHVNKSNKVDFKLFNYLLEFAKRIILWRWMSKAKRKYNQKFPYGVLAFMDKNDKSKIPESLHKIMWKKAEVAELVIHPAVATDCKYFGKITEQRLYEYSTFSNVDTLKLIKNENIELTNFNSLIGMVDD